MKKDIGNKKDIEKLVDSFYEKVKKDGRLQNASRNIVIGRHQALPKEPKPLYGARTKTRTKKWLFAKMLRLWKKRIIKKITVT